MKDSLNWRGRKTLKIKIGADYMIRKYKKITIFFLGLMLLMNGLAYAGENYDSRRQDVRRESTYYPYLNKTDHLQYIEGYSDGTVRPNDRVTREEVAAVIYRLLNPGYKGVTSVKYGRFSDVERERWSSDYIEVLTRNGILKGYKDGSFKPKKYITRAELAVLVGRIESTRKGTVNRFNDLDGHWARHEINTAADRGWIKGYKDGSFKPDAAITRAEFVSFMNGVLERNPDRDGILPNLREYKDLKEDKWYYLPMVEALNSHTYRRGINNKEKWNKLIDKKF